MNTAQAQAIAGKLSWTTKMPGPSYSLPVSACSTGGKLGTIRESVCNKCYAKRGNYAFHTEARNQRLASLTHPQWVEAMVHLVRDSGCSHFRWHDAGDLQSVDHFHNIMFVAWAVPEVQFWLPTQEIRIIRQVRDYATITPNLTVRVSSPMIDGEPLSWPTHTSGVYKNREPQGFACPAPTQGGRCSTCRACWSKEVKHVEYKQH